MILAHHMGEALIPALVAGGGSAMAMLLFVWRVWVYNQVDRLRRR